MIHEVKSLYLPHVSFFIRPTKLHYKPYERRMGGKDS